MHHIHSAIFNPEVLYVLDFWNEKENLHGAHQHEFMEISIILEGFVEYQFNDETILLGAGQVLLFNPHVVHNEYHPKGIQSRELHIGLSNIHINDLNKDTFPVKSPLLNLGPYHGTFLEKAWQLSKEYTEEKYNYQLMGKGLIIEMLTLILRSLEKESTNQLSLPLPERTKNKQTLVNQAIYYMENNYSENITLELLAQKLYISTTQLSKIFREVSGLSPINYLINIRLKRAKELLIHSNLSIKEVAAKVGYDDPSYFSKLFKKRYGKAPLFVKET